jgi:hypothetical protein
MASASIRSAPAREWLAAIGLGPETLSVNSESEHHALGSHVLDLPTALAAAKAIRQKLRSGDKHSGHTVLWRPDTGSGPAGYAAGADPVGASS